MQLDRTSYPSMYALAGLPGSRTATSASDTCVEAASGSVYIVMVRMPNFLGISVSKGLRKARALTLPF